MANLRYVKERGRWRVRWRATDRNSHRTWSGSKVFHEKSQAVEFYAEIEKQERLFRSGKITPGEAIDDVYVKFLRHIARFTKRTQQHYRSVLAKFIASLPKGIIRIHQLEPYHIQDYLYSMAGLLNRTQNAHLTVVKSFCRFFSERYGIDNPSARVRMLKEDPPNSRFITREEYLRLLEIAHPMARHRIIFLANTGLRASEFASLRFENAGAKAITVAGKGRRRRTVPLNKSAREVLPFITPASRKALYFQISKLSKKLDGKAFGPNALRHYFGTQLLLNGVSAAKVAKLMGNSVRVVEKHYAHILTADVANATDVLDKNIDL